MARPSGDKARNQHAIARFTAACICSRCVVPPIISKKHFPPLRSSHSLPTLTICQTQSAKLTRGQIWADFIARFGGSWRFIGIFGAFLFIWILLNVIVGSRAADPYPFILLNLLLSCLAAIQAPVIMMSQNRKEAKDRARSEHDYKVNLKAELEIRHLHEKMDFLLKQQSQRLFALQELQIELMEELSRRPSNGEKPGPVQKFVFKGGLMC